MEPLYGLSVADLTFASGATEVDSWWGKPAAQDSTSAFYQPWGGLIDDVKR